MLSIIIMMISMTIMIIMITTWVNVAVMRREEVEEAENWFEAFKLKLLHIFPPGYRDLNNNFILIWLTIFDILMLIWTTSSGCVWYGNTNYIKKSTKFS